jgi:hypothetical protein
MDLAMILVRQTAFMESYDAAAEAERYHDDSWSERIGALIHDRGVLQIARRSNRMKAFGEGRTNIPEILVGEVRLMQNRIDSEEFVSGFLREQARAVYRAGDMLIKIGPKLEVLP